MRMLIKNGRLIDPKNGIDRITDILLEDGKVAQISKGISIKAKTIDATQLWVLPGLVDLHTHLREPGFEYKETIKTGSNAAAAGGFTSIFCMPNTDPVNDNEAVTRFIIDRARQEAKVRIYPIGAITKGSLGRELAEMGELREAGCLAVSDDGRPVSSAEVMRRALEYSKIFDLPVINHCEDLDLSEHGVMNEGVVSIELGLRGIPSSAEDAMVARDLLLAENTGGRLHLAHISTMGSVRLVRDAKKRGVRVTAEACPHHFTLTEEAVRGYDTNAKVNPPLRTEKDVGAIRAGLVDGTIDAIATDHAPHAEDEKLCEFDQAPCGMVGLETAFSLTLDLVNSGVISLHDAVKKLTLGPAGIMGIDRGHLAVESDADLTIIDPKATWIVQPNRMKSKSRNTPFNGWRMNGQILWTLVSGEIVFSSEGEGLS